MTAIQTSSLDEQIAQERARLDAIEAARRERLNQEKREVQEIEGSRQRIAMLQRQKAEERFNDLLKQNAQALDANSQTVAALFGALNNVEQALKSAKPHFAQVEHSFEQQQTLHDRMLQAASEGMINPVQETDTKPLSTAMREEATQLRSIESRITPAIPLHVAAYKWVIQARGDSELRFRLGIAFAVTGVMFTVDLKNLPTEEVLVNQLKAQISRIR